MHLLGLIGKLSNLVDSKGGYMTMIFQISTVGELPLSISSRLDKEHIFVFSKSIC